MRLFNTSAILIIFICLFTTAIATNLNGRISLINNDGAHYQIMLQINTDSEPQELGGATIIIDYTNNLLSYPDEPEMGVDYVFSNFNMGYYDEARVTKVNDNQIWINVDLISNEYGTIVAGGPYLWTDFVQLNFLSTKIITENVVFWDIYSSYWGVYNSDNLTIWGIGNFDNIISSNENEILDTQINSYYLSQNYPNPFNPSTVIEYYVPQLSKVKVVVYNAIGEEVATLMNEEKSIGYYKVEFSGANIPSGIYFYRLQSESYIETKKMVLLR